MAEVRTLVEGLVVGESPRWHDGRLWFSNWGDRQIMAVDEGGKAEVIAPGPMFAGFSLEWLPDGRLLVTGPEGVLRREADGSFVVHADLREFGTAWNEIVVDGRGNIYVNDVGFQFGQEEFRPGSIVLVRPDGSAQRVATGVAFPNGMIVTPDNATLIIAESWANRLTAFDIEPDGTLTARRVWAETGGDGICLDAEGAVWCAGVTETGAVVTRVAEGGAILDRIPLDHACFACMLGGSDGRTLHLMVAEWRGIERMGELFQSHTGQILTVPVSVPHAGRS